MHMQPTQHNAILRGIVSVVVSVVVSGSSGGGGGVSVIRVTHIQTKQTRLH